MKNHQHAEPNYGMGEKKLSVYLIGFILCIILTLVAFEAVMSHAFSRGVTFTIIYAAACIQLMVQLICFLRLNTETRSAQTNVMSLIFAGVITISIVGGSLWIMSNIGFYMMN